MFIFDLNLYMTLSSADNPFKQFGPRILSENPFLFRKELNATYGWSGLRLYDGSDLKNSK